MSDLQKLEAETLAKIAAATSIAALEDVRVSALGKMSPDEIFASPLGAVVFSCVEISGEGV